MTELTDNVTEVIKIIVDATSDAVVKKMKPVIEKLPVKAEIVLHGETVTDNIKQAEEESIIEKIRAEISQKSDSIPWRNNDYDSGFVVALEWVLDDVISKYKPVQPKAKAGKWIRQKSYSGYTHTYECSECGRTIYAEDDDLTDFPYCHCGAKMEG